MTSPNEEKNILPEYISVQIGKNKFNIASEYLISSMVQQVIHKNNSLYNSDDYMMVFDVTKIEVTNYLETLTEEQLECFDLLGDWLESFDEFQVNKNKVFCKDLIVEFSDKSRWILKFLDIMTIKNQLEGVDEDLIDPKDEILQNEEVFLNFINEKLSWKDVCEHAELIKSDENDEKYDEEWKNATKEIIPWDKNLSIFDFISMGDIILEEDEIDDDGDDDL
jgi:hypothetical protein